jgi:LemA protein
LSGIHIQCRKRAELLPGILKIAQKFMGHEQSLLREIVMLRAQILQSYDQTDSKTVQNYLNTSEKLNGKIGQFFMNAENYPDLKSDTLMIQAQQTYNEVEQEIAAARRFYNSSVKMLNDSVQTFPGNLIAGLINISEMAFYETGNAVTAPIDVDDYLK